MEWRLIFSWVSDFFPLRVAVSIIDFIWDKFRIFFFFLHETAVAFFSLLLRASQIFLMSCFHLKIKKVLNSFLGSKFPEDKNRKRKPMAPRDLPASRGAACGRALGQRATAGISKSHIPEPGTLPSRVRRMRCKEAGWLPKVAGLASSLQSRRPFLHPPSHRHELALGHSSPFPVSRASLWKASSFTLSRNWQLMSGACRASGRPGHTAGTEPSPKSPTFAVPNPRLLPNSVTSPRHTWA